MNKEDSSEAQGYEEDTSNKLNIRKFKKEILHCPFAILSPDFLILVQVIVEPPWEDITDHGASSSPYER